MSTYQIDQLRYTAEIKQQYEKFISLPGFVLLESADTMRGRYDILSAWPYEVLDSLTPVAASNLIHDLRQKLAPKQSVCDLPFQGGAIGYFSYDFADSTSGHTASQLPLAHLGLYDWALIVDHHAKQVSLFSANTRAETPEIINEFKKVWYEEIGIDDNFSQLATFEPLITSQQYQASFSRIQQALQQGRCYQVNLTQPFTAPFSGNPWFAYRQICAANPAAYAAYLTIGEASILSFSPEQFLKLNNGYLQTSPIKGTAKKTGNSSDDARVKEQLTSSIKNKAENTMIVDLLRNDLGRIAKPGSVKVSALCALEEYPFLFHLVSCIEAELQPAIAPIDAFIACFPGGSVTGAPKLEAMRVIDEEEPFKRGIYCGSIGYFSQHGHFETNIAIRTVVAENNMLSLSVGGALVIDSEVADEYNECLVKMNSVLKGMKN